MAFGTYEKKIKEGSNFMQNWVDHERYATRPKYMRNLTFEQWKEGPSNPEYATLRKEQLRLAFDKARNSKEPTVPIKIDMTQPSRILHFDENGKRID